MKRSTTPDVVVAFSQCKAKAFFLLCANIPGAPHEYLSILKKEETRNREKYFSAIKSNNPGRLKQGDDAVVGTTMQYGLLKAYVDGLTRVKTASHKTHSYQPLLVVGTFKITWEQKLHLAFLGHVLSKLQNERPVLGMNNNNAERAVKAFAKLRNIISGTSTAKGIDEYLTVLSICQTCKYSGVDFLDFMSSGERDIWLFAANRRHRRVKHVYNSM